MSRKRNRLYLLKFEFAFPVPRFAVCLGTIRSPKNCKFTSKAATDCGRAAQTELRVSGTRRKCEGTTAPAVTGVYVQLLDMDSLLQV